VGEKSAINWGWGSNITIDRIEFLVSMVRILGVGTFRHLKQFRNENQHEKSCNNIYMITI
jgi:hypothetical protein